MKSSNAQAWNTKHILLNNLGSKRSLVRNMANLCDIINQKFLSKSPTKNVVWKLDPGPF